MRAAPGYAERRRYRYAAAPLRRREAQRAKRWIIFQRAALLLIFAPPESAMCAQNVEKRFQTGAPRKLSCQRRRVDAAPRSARIGAAPPPRRRHADDYLSLFDESCTFIYAAARRAIALLMNDRHTDNSTNRQLFRAAAFLFDDAFYCFCFYCFMLAYKKTCLFEEMKCLLFLRYFNAMLLPLLLLELRGEEVCCKAQHVACLSPSHGMLAGSNAQMLPKAHAMGGVAQPSSRSCRHKNAHSQM